MKKLTLLILGAASLGMVACNGGGSSSSGGSGGGGSANTPQPEVYNAQIPEGGQLVSTTNLYLSTSSSEIPLQFGVENLTSDVTVKFTVQAGSNASNSSLKNVKNVTNQSLPSISPQECVFSLINPQPCTITMNASVAPAGNYSIVPSTTTTLTPITITTVAQSSFTFPDGNYTTSEYFVNGDCQITPASESIVVSNGQICFNYGQIDCQNNHPIPIPSGSNPFNGRGYLSNVAWTGSVATFYWTPEGCPGLLAPITITKSMSNNVLSTAAVVPFSSRNGRTVFSVVH